MYLIIYREKEREASTQSNGADAKQNDENSTANEVFVPKIVNVVEIPRKKLTWAKNTLIAYNADSSKPYIAELVEEDDDGLVAFLYRDRKYDIDEYGNMAKELRDQFNTIYEGVTDRLDALLETCRRKIALSGGDVAPTQSEG